MALACVVPATGDQRGVIAGQEFQPRDEAIVLVDGKPTILSDVAAKGVFTNCQEDLLAEIL